MPDKILPGRLEREFFAPDNGPRSEYLLRELSSAISAKKLDAAVGEHFRPKVVGFNTSILGQGPNLSELIDEEIERELGDQERRVGFLDALQPPERGVRTWVVGFWREPLVMFLFDHQQDFLVDEEKKKYGIIELDLNQVVNVVNAKFKEIMQRLGVVDAGDPFLVFYKDKNVRIQVEKEEFMKMIVAIQSSNDFNAAEKKELVDLINGHISS